MQTAVVTGIGCAAAKRFINEDAFVFLVDRWQHALDAAVADLVPRARDERLDTDKAYLDRFYES